MGCLEGAISIFFAQNGFSTVGVDARSSHISKAEFASNVLGLSNRCSWICSDVTDQDFWQTIGKFDIIICSGLLYHIDACDIHPLLVNIFEHCKSKGIAVIDTNIASSPVVPYVLDNNLTLQGLYWHEHDPDASHTDKILLVGVVCLTISLFG